MWAILFDELARNVLGFNANTDKDPLSTLRGANVMVTIKKRTNDTYVNYSAKKSAAVVR